MKKKEVIFEHIFNAILVECSIRCEMCNKEIKEYNIDEYYFAERLIQEGWSFKQNRILCDECSKTNT